VLCGRPASRLARVAPPPRGGGASVVSSCRCRWSACWQARPLRWNVTTGPTTAMPAAMRNESRKPATSEPWAAPHACRGDWRAWRGPPRPQFAGRRNTPSVTASTWQERNRLAREHKFPAVKSRYVTPSGSGASGFSRSECPARARGCRSTRTGGSCRRGSPRIAKSRTPMALLLYFGGGLLNPGAWRLRAAVASSNSVVCDLSRVRYSWVRPNERSVATGSGVRKSVARPGTGA
jgi:hypothetical protein